MSILYEGTTGVRICGKGDIPEDLDVDLHQHSAQIAGKRIAGKLWMGNINDTRAEKVLTPLEISALRDACARMLVEMRGKPKDKAVLAMIEADL